MVGVVAICWTAFGNLQLAMGYVDVYPVAQMLVALYALLGVVSFYRSYWAGQAGHRLIFDLRFGVYGRRARLRRWRLCHWRWVSAA